MKPVSLFCKSAAILTLAVLLNAHFFQSAHQVFYHRVFNFGTSECHHHHHEKPHSQSTGISLPEEKECSLCSLEATGFLAYLGAVGVVNIFSGTIPFVQKDVQSVYCTFASNLHLRGPPSFS